MDVDRIATIRRHADTATNCVSKGLAVELCDALEAAQFQADKYRSEAHLLTQERDALQAENTRLLDLLANPGTIQMSYMGGLVNIDSTGMRQVVDDAHRYKGERDRFASQVTLCREFLTDLIDTYAEKGRIPADFEAEAVDLMGELGSLAEQASAETEAS